MQRLYFGDITVDRLVESEGRSFYAGYLFPDSDDQAVLEEKKWD